MAGGPETSVSTASPRLTGNHECIFCGRRFTRKGTVWNCAERYLKKRKTDVPCPRPECKTKKIVLEDEMRFKNHAKVVHGIDLRLRIIIKVRTVETNPPLEESGEMSRLHDERLSS
ncbi:hypothetical protein QBC46DRAFT_394045 [Diplogelasinospora grovesii]|uniref:C2H2-type domain-containing protein n=1 Tax=Diplogelasinospora grovesii TaxID=303347 RepID=A0AAN6N0F9_9PEZI|nr:hypothetical protein QBC46DRAFT_394045 [Diplogelasinospora grovesii]